eukprot:3734429-Prymnesium_polylepis.1
MPHLSSAGRVLLALGCSVVAGQGRLLMRRACDRIRRPRGGNGLVGCTRGARGGPATVPLGTASVRSVLLVSSACTLQSAFCATLSPHTHTHSAFTAHTTHVRRPLRSRSCRKKS